MKQATGKVLYGFLLGILFDPEDGGETFFRLAIELPNYTVLQSKGQCSS
jgi:hypothetical protein